jgi:hypothetical protein
MMSTVARHGREVFEIAGVRQDVEIEERLIGHSGIVEPLEDEVAADETGAACDQNCHPAPRN